MDLTPLSARLIDADIGKTERAAHLCKADLLTEVVEHRPEPAEPIQRQSHGSFAALVRDYLASASFKEKRSSTQGEYRRVLEGLAAQHGLSGHLPGRPLLHSQSSA